jgi:hypothetical protein
MSSVGQVTSSGDGMFIVGGQKMDLGTLMMMLQLDRTEQLDLQIQDQMNEISQRNNKLKAMNDLLSQMRTMKSKGSDDDGSITIGDQTKSLWRGKDNKGTGSWAKEFGIHWTDIKGGDTKTARDGKWDTNIENLKGVIDGMNSDSQLSMIRLQSLIDKRNQAYEMASNTLQKVSQNMDKLVGNLR